MQNPISRESSLSRAREYEDAKRVAALFCDVQDPRLDRPLYAEVHSHRTYGFYVQIGRAHV